MSWFTRPKKEKAKEAPLPHWHEPKPCPKCGSKAAYAVAFREADMYHPRGAVWHTCRHCRYQFATLPKDCGAAS